ncbi:reprolysin-like metallopeptidase [Pseudofulvibacter geojedonensis]|uniref:Reprolysin-like metallopeptidase n=1 Tax=Pseudofulvibacter geojedonensis TaxID=1123758 RepID=A0ABW3I0Q7_9FLAO
MKKDYTKKLMLLALIIFNSVALFAQDNNRYWTKASKEKLSSAKKVHRASQPRTFEVFQLDIEKFKQAIQNAPVRGEFAGRSNVIASFPTPEGTFERFRIAEAPIMEQGLAEKFPMIKSYAAQGIDDPTATMRFTITQFGLHTMTLSGNRNSMYIDPYTDDRLTYMVYDKNSLGQDSQSFECLLDTDIDFPSITGDVASQQRADTDDQTLRTYRLAQSCTGEYGAIFAGGGTVAQQKANVQAQMAITMARVNGIYERDLAITMIFIANNDQIIYLDAATDPWNGEYNTTTGQTIDSVIGQANYDIGHNFNTTGGGSAGCLGCVCSVQNVNNFHKGIAYTGRADPTGDPFDIDYVAHEMGHQFDAYHTMNTCSRSGNGTTEVEPASGSSIMGYAGICATNVQPNSDAHFNYVNIRDVSDNIQTGVSSSCATPTALTNQPPVANAGADYTIPRSTAFVLTGSSTDPDGTAEHTYNWAPNDPAQAPTNAAPQPTWTSGPMYRSIHPTASPERWLPSIADVVAGNLTPTWEVTPSVARTMNFSFVVRDNASGFANGIGQTDADLMVVTVENVDPFTMSAPNTAVTWTEGGTETVTWNVGSTTNGTINCQNVDILLSTDGGYTYPTVLLANTPNDGSQTITVPATPTNTARVMVRAADNIFYDISDTNFSIVGTSPTFTMANSNGDQGTCGSASVDFEFDFTALNGFNENTVFSATGNPAGSTVSFSPTSLSATGTFTMTVGNLGGVAENNYTITVTGTSASVTQNVDVTLSVVNSLCASVANTTYQTSTTRVAFNTIDNPSAKPAGYSDYTAMSTDVNRESSYPLTIQANTDGNYTTISTVWVDWNQNCVFDVATEEYDLGSANNVADGATSNSGLSIMVPSDAALGATTMRVTTKYSSAATSCENGHDAEVEDYTVNVQESLSVVQSDFNTFSLIPNPTEGIVNLTISTTDKVNISLFDIRGRLVFDNTYQNNSSVFNQEINLGELPSGMYIFTVTSGAKKATQKLIIE